MKKSKLLFVLISCFFVCISCKEKSVSLSDLPSKDIKGNTQVLVATPSQSEIYIEFDATNERYIETEKSYTLNNLAHTGYLAGKTSLQKVIVLGETAQTGKLVSALPIGLIRFNSEKQTTDWPVFADVNSEICSMEDFLLNHHPLKIALQTKLKINEDEENPKITWFDEAFLEMKIEEVL